MGGQGAALRDALVYSNVLFGGAVVIWLTNVLVAIVRGAGNMLQPSLALLGAALAHLALCPLLVFGWGPMPALGIAGAAASTLVTHAVAAMAMGVHLLRPEGVVNLKRLPRRLHAELLLGILRVGLPSSVAPLISNGSVALTTAFVGSFGLAALAGYGVAATARIHPGAGRVRFRDGLTAMVATNLGARTDPLSRHSARRLGPMTLYGYPQSSSHGD
jgi:Na+-driven multidrug efflux pump